MYQSFINVLARANGRTKVFVYTHQVRRRVFSCKSIYYYIHEYAFKVKKVKRRGTKAASMVFRLKEPLAQFLRHEAEKHHRTMTSIVEELLAYRKNFKSWPPNGA
jgi:hypothetical protein